MVAAEGGARTPPGGEAKPLNRQFSNMPTTIFSVMSALALQHQAVNLGQGFPDEEGPQGMKEQAAKALIERSNQYPSLLGVPELRRAVARHSERQHLPVDWTTEALITIGATEGIAATLMALVNPGDEVVVFEPLYDSYVAMCEQCGGVLVPVQLQPPDWSIPADALEAAFGPKTKLVLVNTPHNPTGKVFTREELQGIADLALRHGAYVLCDEVYEHLVFEGAEHVSVRALPGMRDRAVRLGSAGKTFSLTGWKVGWVTGPAALIGPITKAHQFITFTVPPNLQHAVAYGLENEEPFYLGLGAELQRKRQLLEPRLQALGLTVLPAQGTYFLVADVTSLLRPGEDDFAFCQRLTAEAGVTLIPVSAFYHSQQRPHHLVRFAFCKEDAKILEACRKLETYIGSSTSA